jgi:hypothetical protein
MPKCTVDGCETPQWARGWCEFHYHRWRRTGDVQADKPRQGSEPFVHKHCALPACGKLMRPKRLTSGYLEARTEFARRKYCSRACAVQAQAIPVIDGRKECRKCRQVRSLTEFGRRGGYVKGRCRACHAADKRQRRVESPTVAASARRNSRVDAWVRRELAARHRDEYLALLGTSKRTDDARYEAFRVLRERYRAEYEQLRAEARRREWEAAS